MTELKNENAELKLKNFQLSQFCEASAEGFDNLNNKIAELEKDNEALKSKDKLASGIIGALNDRERQLEKEKNYIWDRNTQLKFDMDKLEKKVKRQQETITEQRKDILILRAKE